ncbi:MAG: ferritin-like domain-containing protein [Thiobacillaceae bacterium]
MNLHAAARAALAEEDVEAKLAAAARLWSDWQAGRLTIESWTDPQPVIEAGRPARPELVAPEQLPRRELSHPEGHAALIHALAHIEFSAINLALDAAYRFPGLPAAYYADWLKVAAEEAHHFRLLRDHLRGLGHDYGDFPAHAGLWALAVLTADDALARMALVPRLMEARGLDATPGIRRKLAAHGDAAGAAILDIILRDEITHVAAGDRWFRHLCAERGLAPEATWRRLVLEYDVPKPRRPFNEAARRAAGFSAEELASW